MGYTHYWTFANKVNKKDYKNTLKMIGDFVMYSQTQGYRLGNGYGSFGSSPELSGDINFNGLGTESCENFLLFEKYQAGFNFCKTNSKPYDAVVVGALLILKGCLGDDVEVNSDGSGDDFNEAFELLYNYFIKLNKDHEDYDTPDYKKFCALCLKCLKS